MCSFWMGIFEFSPRADILIWLKPFNALKMAVLHSFLLRKNNFFFGFVMMQSYFCAYFNLNNAFFITFIGMMLQDLTFTEKIRRNVTLCTKLHDNKQMNFINTIPFGSRTKCYKWLTHQGTVYAIRKGNEFRKPLLTYKTFCKYLEKNELVHVASTGHFAGRYIIRIMNIL